MYKMLFFGCFAIGCAGLILTNGIRINTITTVIAIYMVVLSMMYVLGIGDAHKHIRVSFTFWGMGLLYFGLLDESGRRKIGKYLLFLFAFTTITSTIGVLFDNSAARTLTHAGADDALQASYALRNISSIYLFQGLVYFVPIAICLPETGRQRIIGCIILVLILVILMNASFTISLIVYAAAILLSVMCISEGRNKVILIEIICVLMLILWFNMGSVLRFAGTVIDNPRISVRINELAEFFSSGSLEGDASMRWEQYSMSIATFLKNPFGVGAHYAYRVGVSGIGYHSQLFDDLARYGVFAIAFYSVFFTGYFKALKIAWSKLGCPQIAGVFTLVYLLFLTLNLGFRSSDDSILLLCIIPELPSLLEQRKNCRICI